MAHLAKIQIASVDEVNETTRRPHCHIHPGTQLPDLLTDVHSSIITADYKAGGRVLELTLHLLR